jgi:uncharacterized damage-inducible protein DinB
MSVTDEQGRPEPPFQAGEVETLFGFLDFQRATMQWKCAGLSTADLNTSVAASTMTLGGLLKHMAWVEDHWFSYHLHGRDRLPIWQAVNWSDEPSWEWESAASDSPETLMALWEAAVVQSRADVGTALKMGGLDHLAARGSRDTAPNLRWIIVHMIEEYARHNGHADIMREAIDGETGE